MEDNIKTKSMQMENNKKSGFKQLIGDNKKWRLAGIIVNLMIIIVSAFMIWKSFSEPVKLNAALIPQKTLPVQDTIPRQFFDTVNGYALAFIDNPPFASMGFDLVKSKKLTGNQEYQLSDSFGQKEKIKFLFSNGDSRGPILLITEDRADSNAHREKIYILKATLSTDTALVQNIITDSISFAKDRIVINYSKKEGGSKSIVFKRKP